MKETRQSQLRQLAQEMVETADPNQEVLAKGTLDLLDYTDTLLEALEATTRAWCEALCLVQACSDRPEWAHLSLPGTEEQAPLPRLTPLPPTPDRAAA
ncbi:MAG: hypothetical protein HC884_03650 [Chloroflexaceae bacterium]|nr:hypothetical protein [Chloroflexaceae bacterium]